MSIKKIHFISGLPRSGTTLLSSILNQNDRFYSGPNSPVINMMFRIEEFKNDEMNKAFPRNDSLEKVKSSIIYNYYFDDEQPIVFDKNRGWVGHIDFIKQYITSNPKIICTVRSVKDVLTSFITLFRKNNYPNDSFINTTKLHENDSDICMTLLTTGIVGISIRQLIDGFNKYPNNILFVHYDDIVENTDNTLKRIYNFINEDYISTIHTQKIKEKYIVDDYEAYRLIGMHTIRDKIEKISKKAEDILPADIIELCNIHPVIQEFEQIISKHRYSTI